MSNLISNSIDQKSFSRFKFKLLLRNETSHTQVVKSESLSIIELQETGILMRLPLNACQKSHNVTIFFLDIEAPVPAKLPENGTINGTLFEAISKVIEIEVNLKDKQFVTAELRFSQYDVQHWKNMMSQCLENQEKISSIISKQLWVENK